MKLSEIYLNNSKKTIISFEVFPPKGENFEEKTNALILELKELQSHKPALVSITYGAGGSNKDNSFELTTRIKEELEQTVMPHLTCVCAKKEEIEKYIKQIEQKEIKNILALRGDKPKEIGVCHQDFKYANELIEFIKDKTELEFAVSAYPERHIDAKSLDFDIEILKKKQDLGAKVAFTQLFFKNENYYKFIELCNKKDINIPIIPGILPIVSFNQLNKMALLGNIEIEKKTYEFFEKYQNSKEDTMKAGIEFASIQCEKLLNFGVKGLHFYTLNKSFSTDCVIKNVIC